MNLVLLRKLSCNDARRWIEAMNEEINSLKVNDTWTLIPLPKECKPIASKWIYKLKEGVTELTTKVQGKVGS